MSFAEALSGGRRPERAPEANRVAKAFVGQPAVLLLGLLAKALKECPSFGGMEMGKPTGKELALAKRILEDFGLETARKMAECLVWDWTAAQEKWRLRDETPGVSVLWWKRNDLAKAVADGEGLWTITHRVSAWATMARGEKPVKDIWA